MMFTAPAASTARHATAAVASSARTAFTQSILTTSEPTVSDYQVTIACLLHNYSHNTPHSYSY
jgi:hypothetical protein